MKNLRWLFIGVIVVLLPLYLYSQETVPEVKVIDVNGKAHYQTPTEADWQSLSKGKALGTGSALKTDLNSYVEFEMSPGNQFRLKENSQLKIKEVAASKDVVKLTEFDLLDGEIISKLDKLPKNTLVQVSSPTAVAGARGTAFGVRYRSNNQLAKVSVLHDEVTVTSVGEPNKQQTVTTYQKVTVAPWKMAMFQVRGTGILSEKILGKAAIEKAKNSVLEAEGKGDTLEAAKDNAYVKLARMVLGITIGRETKIEDLLNKDPHLVAPLYSYIAKAEVIEKQEINSQVEVTVKLAVAPISDIIGRKLPELPQIVKPISMQEYGDKFGALARVTTQRAAQLDGYRKLAEAMYGTVVSSKTTLQDYVVKDDRIVTTVQGVVKGAEVLDTRYYSDGSLSVVMTIRADLIKSEVAKVTGDIFGTKYFSSPTAIDIEDFLGAEW